MSKRYITLEDVRYILDEYDDRYSETTLCVIPPNASELTDEDDSDSDVAIAADETVSETLGKLELEITARDVDDGKQVNENQRKRNKLSESSEPSTKRPRKTVSASTPGWKKVRNLTFSKISGQTGQTAAHADCDLRLSLSQHSPVQLFEEFFTPEVYDLMTIESVRYSTDVKNDPKFSTSPQELKTFLGILIYTGYRGVPSETDFWSDADDLGVPIIKQAMSRNQYQKLKSRIHFVDNSTAKSSRGDRSFKMRPLFDMLNANFCKFGYFTPHINIGEMTVKYEGGEKLERFLRRKSIRLGFKYWAMCSSDGYCYNFSLYGGKETDSTPTGIVLSTIQRIPDPSSYTLYLDSSFTSMELLSQLADKGLRTTGAIRGRKIKGTCPLKSLKEFKKMDIGVNDYVFDETSEVLLVRWRDDDMLTVATNYDSVEPFHDAKRRVKRFGERLIVKMPNVISNYNAHGSGVDHHDCLVSKYSVSVYRQKWYWPLFTRCVDMAVVNAWVLHKIISGKNAMSLLEFRRAIATVYLKLPQPRRFGDRPRVAKLPVGAHMIRLDGVGHFLMPREKQRRCQNEGCNSKPKTYCGKCNVTLCRSCFQPYHVV